MLKQCNSSAFHILLLGVEKIIYVALFKMVLNPKLGSSEELQTHATPFLKDFMKRSLNTTALTPRWKINSVQQVPYMALQGRTGCSHLDHVCSSGAAPISQPSSRAEHRAPGQHLQRGAGQHQALLPTHCLLPCQAASAAVMAELVSLPEYFI